MRGLLLVLVALVLGCSFEVKSEPTIKAPAVTVVCPICQAEARLTYFTERGANYECDDHRLELNRKDGTFAEGRVKSEFDKKVDRERREAEKTAEKTNAIP